MVEDIEQSFLIYQLDDRPANEIIKKRTCKFTKFSGFLWGVCVCVCVCGEREEREREREKDPLLC
jgi:hypothetical protein